MNQSTVGTTPAKWQVTATTIHCDLVDDFVTILVKGDWTTQCVWYNHNKGEDSGKQKLDNKTKLAIEKCTGPDCSYVVSYRDKLIQEEASTE